MLHGALTDLALCSLQEYRKLAITYLQLFNTMFNLYFFVDYNPDLANGEPEPCTIAFDIVHGESIYGEAYVREGDFETMEDAVSRLNNIGSRWFFYPNACITESVGKKEILVGIYLADGRNFTLSDPEYRILKQEAQLVDL